MSGANDYQVVDPSGRQSSHDALPTVGAVRAGWTLPYVVLEGGDLGGTVSVFTAGAHPASSEVLDVLFNQEFAIAPRAVVMSGPLGPYATNVKSSGFTITIGGVAVPNNTYLWSFVVVP